MDAAAVAWVSSALRPWGEEWPPRIDELVPDGYPAYARVLHPAHDPNEGEVSWARVSEWSGRQLKPDSLFEDIATRDDGSRWPGAGPHEGQLEREVCTRLARLFGPFTTTPGSVWYCVWAGWGGLRGPEIDLQPAITSRSFRIYRGPLEAVGGLIFDLEDPGSAAVLTSSDSADPAEQPSPPELGFYAPSLWWPEDRAWFGHTEVDARSTYIGGSEAMIRTLLEDHQLEVLPAALEHTFDGVYPGMPRLLD